MERGKEDQEGQKGRKREGRKGRRGREEGRGGESAGVRNEEHRSIRVGGTLADLAQNPGHRPCSQELRDRAEHTHRY